MFESFLVPPKLELDPKLPAYRRVWPRLKGALWLTFWVVIWAGSFYDIYRMFRVK